MSAVNATSTVTVPGISQINHREAMTLAETEYRRFATLLGHLDAAEWRTPTECPPWTVRDMATHVLGYLRAHSSIREQLRQVRAAKRRGGPVADALSALQVEELADLTGEQIVAETGARVASATRGRRNTPWPVRKFGRLAVELPVSGAKETWTMGFFVDVIGTRDTWMHRMDICRATGRVPDLSHDHDGRLVADIVADWARRHQQAFELRLTGPAGGSYRAGTDGPELTHDAVDFCRALSGRSAPLPFGTEVPF